MTPSKLCLVLGLLLSLSLPSATASSAKDKFKTETRHPPMAEIALEEDSDHIKWFKENWGLDDDSGWIQFYRDIELILAEPEEEPEEDESRSSLCRSVPGRDLKWKYCGFYTGLKESADHEKPSEDL